MFKPKNLPYQRSVIHFIFATADMLLRAQHSMRVARILLLTANRLIKNPKKLYMKVKKCPRCVFPLPSLFSFSLFQAGSYYGTSFKILINPNTLFIQARCCSTGVLCPSIYFIFRKNNIFLIQMQKHVLWFYNQFEECKVYAALLQLLKRHGSFTAVSIKCYLSGMSGIRQTFRELNS